jgi:hypothetical protein
MRRDGLHNRAARRRAEKCRRRMERLATSGGTALTALTSSVLALPGLAGNARADAPVDRIYLDVSGSYYKEDKISPSKVAPGTQDRERYEIQMYQAHLTTPAPFFKNVDLDFDLVYETMSGATPYYVVPEPPNGKPIQVLSGPTIQEQRTDVSMAINRYLEDGRISVMGGVSTENDYLAGYFGADLEKHFNDRNTTGFLGLSASIDTITPTDPEIDNRVTEADKRTVTLFAGVSQIIGRVSAIQGSLTYRYNTGYLSDPYKLAYVQGETPNEKRPAKRDQVTLEARYRRHFRSLAGTLQLDYAFYVDTWDITAHTFDFRWLQDLWSWGRVIPSFRYYSQGQADFYAEYFILPPSTGYFSSDYRLSPYGAISYGLRFEGGSVVERWGGFEWRLFGSYMRYLSDAEYALGDVAVANPGLVNFHLFTAGFSGSF